ncbi:MAG: hypothetical protein II924_04135 [Kiritimatiellae bacterium]|nr:hypothetical protein [Kiritimatiellia bacterium]
MKTFARLASVACVAACAGGVFAAEALTDSQEAVAKAGPKKVRLMIASFGTIESMTQVEKWLGETIPEQQNIATPPTLSQAEKVENPDLVREVVRINWQTRKMEFVRESNAVQAENLRNRRLLQDLRMKALTDPSQRYVPVAKDYLQASLAEKGSLIQIVDRSNADMSLVEQGLSGDNESVLAGATCILTAAMGDREEESRTITVNAKGTKVKKTTYTQPYVGKVRDLQGNVLFAFKGTSEWSVTVNNIVKSELADPERKLVEIACDQIAEKLLDFFTCKLSFKVKAPAGLDADDATVKVDGKTVDAEDAVRVLKVEHAVVATLDGCKKVSKIVELDETDSDKTVKIVFKKPAAEEEGED